MQVHPVQQIILRLYEDTQAECKDVTLASTECTDHAIYH